MKNQFLHIVSDYGVNDPAFGEVLQRLAHLNQDLPVTMYPTSVPAFNTIATGFWIYEFALGDHPEGMVVYSNTAPRKETKKAMEHNSGEKLLYAKLINGVEIVAVNAGYCFSFIKPYISELRDLRVENKGSQFRSRDFYPKAVAAVLHKDKSIFGETLDTSIIVDAPEKRIAWIDGYGNIKTTIRKSSVSLKPGTKVPVEIEGVKRTALVAGGSFSVQEGELAFSPGSSGYEDPFMELFLRGGSAKALFDDCLMGAHINL